MILVADMRIGRMRNRASLLPVTWSPGTPEPNAHPMGCVLDDYSIPDDTILILIRGNAFGIPNLGKATQTGVKE